VLIYKICPAPVWREAQQVGSFNGSAVDLADGFIHFSTAAQVKETVSRHFAGQPDLVIVAFESEALGPELKWEPSRGGALFPHLYKPLDTALAVSTTPLPLGAHGQHIIPALR
jgi:uncharacterized protein (DUF952 family)